VQNIRFSGHRFQTGKHHLPIVRKADSIHLEKPQHLIEIGFGVFDFHLAVTLPCKAGVEILRFSANRGKFFGHRAKGNFRRLHGLDGERAGYTHHAPAGLRLVYQFFVFGVGSDAGVHFVHFRPPRGAVGGYSVSQIIGIVGVSIEGNHPVFEALALLGKLPPAGIGVGDGALAFCFLFGQELARQFPADVFLKRRKRGVQVGKAGFENRLVPGKDRVKIGVLGNALEGDMGNGLVFEPARYPLGLVLEFVVVEFPGHQSLPGNRQGHPAGVDGDPSAAPGFRNLRGRSTAACRVQYKIAGVGGHEQTTANGFSRSLNDIYLFSSKSSLTKSKPDICPWCLSKIP